MKYIFPKQFALHNVFMHATDRRETTHAFKDYTDRDAEVASAPKSRDFQIYNRLGPRVLPLIAKMQKFHNECSYHALIEYYCGQSAEETREIDVDVSFGSEDHSKVFTQKHISVLSTGTSDVSPTPSSEEGNIIRYHTPQHKVPESSLSTKQGHRVCLCSGEACHP